MFVATSPPPALEISDSTYTTKTDKKWKETRLQLETEGEGASQPLLAPAEWPDRSVLGGRMERRARQSAAVDFLDEQHRPALGAQADHAISEAAAEDEEIL